MKMLEKLKLILFIIAAVLGTNVFAAEYEDILRVGIYYGSGVVESFGAKSADGFAIGCYDEREFNPVVSLHETEVTAVTDDSWHVMYSECSDAMTADATAKVMRASGTDAFVVYSSGKTYIWCGNFENENDALWEANNLGATGVVKSDNNSIRITDKDGRIVFLLNDGNAELGIAPTDYENYDKTISISGAAKGAYRGGFALKSTEDGKLTVVNVLPVEKYLYGVVSREMSASWHVEALKTQAVCARNFALRRINYHSKYGCDVCRTTCCQAYSGTSAEGENVYKAVDETRGELLMYEGEICQTVYSSSMGSETESVENVWGTPFPYLVSVENPYEDTENVYNGKWTKTLSVERTTEIMKNRGYEIGEVLHITALEYTPAGRVLKLKVQGTGGEKIFEREMCRTIFSEATYSQKYTVTKGGTSTYPQFTVTDGKSNVSKIMKGIALCGDNTTSDVGKIVYVTDGSAKKKYEVISSAGSSDEFVFTGEGWGHGVGMSQYGAKGMAEAGFSYEEILKHYYTGTELVSAY